MEPAKLLVSPLLAAARAVRQRLLELRPKTEGAVRDNTRNLDPDEGRVLTPKNVQALRTIFNVALRLDAVLGSGWELVLETLDVLDHVLYSPRTTTQEISSETQLNGNAQSRPADVNILSAAIQLLFKAGRRPPRTPPRSWLAPPDPELPSL